MHLVWHVFKLKIVVLVLILHCMIKCVSCFYRVHHHLEVGSGLGLSIVDKAIQHLGGELILSKSADLGGLNSLVKLPMNYEFH